MGQAKSSGGGQGARIPGIMEPHGEGSEVGQSQKSEEIDEDVARCSFYF